MSKFTLNRKQQPRVRKEDDQVNNSVLLASGPVILQFCNGALSVPRRQTRRVLVPEAPWTCLFMAVDDRFIEVVEESTSSAVRSETASCEPSTKLQLRQYHEEAAPIATSFIPSAYRTHPVLTNAHLQTIGGVFFRDLEDCAYVTNVAVTVNSVVQRALNREGEQPQNDDEWFWDERQQIDTPDEDIYHVDYKYGTKEQAKGTIVLFHGLQSSSNSPLSIDLANTYHHQLG